MSLPARRFKLESELDEHDRDDVKRLGASGQIERDEYIVARRAALRDADEQDPALIVRLLREEADSVGKVAERREQAARERLSVDDWIARDAAQERGEEPPATLDAKGAALLDKATAMRVEADELEAHMGQVETSPDEHLESLQAGR